MRVATGILLLAGLLGSGCVFHAHPPVHAVGVVHVHGIDCGHFYSGGVWVSMPVGHVHGPFCGHVRAGTVWHGRGKH